MKNWNPIEKCIFALIMATTVLVVFIPLVYFSTTALSNHQEMLQFPKKFLPTAHVTLLVEHQKNGTYKVLLKNGDEYTPTITSKNAMMLQNYFEAELSVRREGDKILEEFSSIPKGESREFTYWKDILYNFKTFFAITTNAEMALWNSVQVVILTILISTTLGSISGYAIARYQFRFKDQINVLLLIVRMFPMVGISIPLAVMLIRMNLYDTMLGLAILYSIPNIALTSWITSSIFIGISRELEEASMVFGATGLQTFFRITLPMSLPALAASSMYSFLLAWNDTISALILTNKNQTLALAVYKAVGNTVDAIQYVAAGGLILIIPAMVFVFIVRKYVNQMWGGVSI